MTASPSPRVVGRYAIHGKIASGGMASVHLGRMLGGAGFSRTVAIKRLHPHLAENPEFRATMIDEARMAARIHHPNVVTTLDVVNIGDELLLVMEYVRGESVSSLMRTFTAREQLIPLPIASAIIVGALHGLHAAHEASDERGRPLGIVHRDVSPQNILVGIDGLPRIIDFGVAKASGRLQTTSEGTIKGKIGYMAPEQLISRPLTGRADVYSIGVVLWEILTNRRLFVAEGEAALISKVIAGPEGPPSRHTPNLPPELDALVLKALATNPVNRFATAREMADLLTRIVPPALATDVGSWCAEAASEALATRGAMVAEVESKSGITSIPPAAKQAQIVEAPTGSISAPAGGTPAKPNDEAGTSGVDQVPRLSQPSSVSTTTTGPIPGLDRGVGRFVLAGGGLVVGCVVALFIARGTNGQGRPPAVATSTPLASATSTPSAAPVPSPSEPTPSAASAPSASTPLVIASAAVARTTPPPAPPRTKQATPAKPAPNCNPDFEYDANGRKHFKPECFVH
jgi:eukaryotic-like serine/threonine-protein kinase